MILRTNDTSGRVPAPWLSVALVVLFATGCEPHRNVHSPTLPVSQDPIPPRACPEGMVQVPPGLLRMGSDNGFAPERPVHDVSMPGFCINRTEVTVGAHSACVRRGLCSAAHTTTSWAAPEGREFVGQFCNGDRSDRQAHPVNCVDWEQADVYCRAVGGRLPTEEEWEYAARGSDGRTYPWGDGMPGPTLLNACGIECSLFTPTGKSTTQQRLFEADDGSASTAPVASYPAGTNAFGLHDMAGNVSEWTASWISSNYSVPRQEKFRVHRGGAWDATDARGVTTTARPSFVPRWYTYTVGLRCVANVP